MLRLFSVVFFIVLGAAVALATEPMYPAGVQDLVAKNQGAVA